MLATLAANIAPVHSVAPVFSAGGDTVLIVEDNDTIGGLLALVLRPVARQTVHVCNGASCQTWFQKNSASACLVVMDCSLPDMHGGSLGRRLRAQVPGLPLMLISGRPQPDLVRLLADDGPTDFLGKPFRPGEVVERARALLAGHAVA